MSGNTTWYPGKFLNQFTETSPDAAKATTEGLECVTMNPGVTAKMIDSVSKTSGTKSRPVAFYPDQAILNWAVHTDNTLFARPPPFQYFVLPIAIFDEGLHVEARGIFALTLLDPFPDMIEFNPTFEYPVTLLRTIIPVESVYTGKRANDHFIIVMDANGNVDYPTIDLVSKRNVKTFLRKVTALYCNFVDFLNMPDVEYKVSAKPQRKRDTHKPPMPQRLIVKVKGETKRYIQEYEPTPGAPKRRHKVRGHIRHFRSDYYTYKKGTTKYIPEHERGRGIAIHKDYEVEK